MQCEGWRRRGGAFTFGPVVWTQCKNDAVVTLTVVQDKNKTEQPACMTCWEEAEITDGIEIKKVVPLKATEGE